MFTQQQVFTDKVFLVQISQVVLAVWVYGARQQGFLPNSKVIMTNDIAGQPVPDQDSLIVDNELYVKFVVGMDYTFGMVHISIFNTCTVLSMSVAEAIRMIISC